MGNRTEERLYMHIHQDGTGREKLYKYEYYQNSNRLKKKERMDGSERYDYEYDANGNLTVKIVTKGEKIDRWEYVYDLLNQLEQVKKNGIVVSSYIYDPNGFRVEKVGSKGKIHYVPLLNGEVGYRKEFLNSKEYSFIYVGGQHLARVNGVIGGSGKKFFYHNDHLGSALAVTDENGNKVVERDFTPFGERINTDVYDDEPRDLDEDESGFTGKDWDEDVGLYYYNARWYDPTIGRFISEDSVADDPSLYVYCGQNPVNYIDPTGHVANGVFNIGPLKINLVQGFMNLAAREIPVLGNILGATSCFSYILPKLGNNPLLFVHGWRDNWTRWVNFITKITGDIEVEPGENGGEGKTLTQLAEEYKSLKPKWGQSKEEKAQNKARQKEITAKVQSALKAHNIYVFDYSEVNKKKPTEAAKKLAQFMADNGLGKETNVVSHSMGANVVANAVIKHGVQFNKWAAIAPVNRGSFLPVYGKIAIMALSYRQTKSWEAGFAAIMGAGIIDSAQQYMDPVFGGVRDLYDGNNLYILRQNVRDIHIFAGTADTAVAPSRALLPGDDYQAKFYSPAEVPGQGFAGQHNTLTETLCVQQDVMDFLYGN